MLPQLYRFFFHNSPSPSFPIHLTQKENFSFPRDKFCLLLSFFQCFPLGKQNRSQTEIRHIECLMFRGKVCSSAFFDQLDMACKSRPTSKNSKSMLQDETKHQKQNEKLVERAGERRKCWFERHFKLKIHFHFIHIALNVGPVEVVGELGQQ